MRILPNYIARNFIATLAAALLVLNFVMSVGLLFKVTQYIARGMSPALVWGFLRGGIPGTLAYSIPVAVLVSSLLVFGRLSTDSEISAMRASGIGVWRIMRAPLIVSAFLAAVCLHINNDVSPQSAYIRASMRGRLQARDVTALIEPGSYVEIGPYRVFAAAAEDGVFSGLHISETTRKGFQRDIRAREAFLIQTNGAAALDMRDVTMDPATEPGSGVARSDRLLHPLDRHDGAAAEKARPRRVKDKYSWMLARDIIAARERPPATKAGMEDLSRARFELSSRLVFTLACVCFALVGMPLGMAQQRRDSTLGVALCLLIAGLFYLFGLLSESLAKRPGGYAHVIVWIPVAICAAACAAFARKNN